MSLNKIILVFLVIFLLFGAVVFYQFTTSNAPKSKVTINKKTFAVKVATSSAEQQKGLSGEAKLEESQGMLFLFTTADKHAFWMKGMKFPLDIIFIQDNKIVDMAEDVKAPKDKEDNLPVYQPDAPVDTVLEINAGLAKKYGFKKNDEVTITLEKK